MMKDCNQHILIQYLIKGWVLVFDEQEGKQIACKVWDAHEDNLWHWANDNGTWLHYVTHWMVLPDDPE